MITIVIPVGPDHRYKHYLAECIKSLHNQTVTPREVVIVDDQAHLDDDWLNLFDGDITPRIIRTSWLSGVAHSFNIGIAESYGDLNLMLGSDDWLQPWAIEDCVNSYRRHQDKLGYYFLDVEYSDGSGSQSLPCNAAMVTKSMWQASGGFPVASAIGQPDTILVSIMMVHPEAGHLIHVDSTDGPPYIARVHDGQVTRNYGVGIHQHISGVRDIVTRDWSPPTWTLEPR